MSSLALAAILAGTLGLAACGKKGPLDLPPGGTVPPAQSAAPDTATDPGAGTPRQPSLFDSGAQRNKPVAPKGEKKPIPLDVLID